VLAVTGLLAESGLLGGPDLLVYLVLAFGGAMFVGNVMALFRPPSKPQAKKKPNRQAAKQPAKAPTTKPQTDKAPAKLQTGKAPATGEPLSRPPKARTITMAAIGGLVSLWAIATLLTK
jgi:hypothetical protein